MQRINYRYQHAGLEHAGVVASPGPCLNLGTWMLMRDFHGLQPFNVVQSGPVGCPGVVVIRHGHIVFQVGIIAPPMAKEKCMDTTVVGRLLSEHPALISYGLDGYFELGNLGLSRCKLASRLTLVVQSSLSRAWRNRGRCIPRTSIGTPFATWLRDTPFGERFREVKSRPCAWLIKLELPKFLSTASFKFFSRTAAVASRASCFLNLLHWTRAAGDRHRGHL
ncbi:uncharacterized protein N7482_004440 [Penicillium canariense]|uniref:Uncharacterized protein n=1 Tax=Penicillium canariense TaxID=189055 RepID=A0A9W9I6M1_9EURO|nr:uncharacterized protein N7482_004440 [Penicillium canariense]KAJ5168846.1 hypothetical protein N7482_004440 [Penicillium canariense]